MAEIGTNPIGSSNRREDLERWSLRQRPERRGQDVRANPAPATKIPVISIVMSYSPNILFLFGHNTHINVEMF